MSEISPWFGRRFEFSLPLELLPNLMARLRGTPARLEDLLRGRPREQLVDKTEEGWTAQEHAGHLYDLEALWTARIADYAEAKESMTPADLTNRKTTEANHNQRPVEEILAAYRGARQLLLETVSRQDRTAFERTLPHPRLGTPMRLIDHLHFVAEHDDHHLARIAELVGQVSFGR
ncbi:MAG: DinB family protein [Acidobacteriota bacterium]